MREGKDFQVVGLPRSEVQLRKMPHFEFENWAVVKALGGVPNKTKVGDMGIDGRIYPVGAIGDEVRRKAGEFAFMDDWYPVQVKQRDKVGRPDIDQFEAVMVREGRSAPGAVERLRVPLHLQGLRRHVVAAVHLRHAGRSRPRIPCRSRRTRQCD